MKITPRQYALRKRVSLNYVYSALWAGRIAGATQDNRGRWSIPVPSDEPKPPARDWKSAQANDQE
jgi:hypothetical protein